MPLKRKRKLPHGGENCTRIPNFYDVHETAKFVEDKLKSFGCDLVETGVGRTGVVGIIKGRHGDGPAIGLRADMDALPITETSGVEWVSHNPGKAHSCGHDGHTSMLLGAAQYLAETRNFRGSVALLFQPAEEGGAGAWPWSRTA